MKGILYFILLFTASSLYPQAEVKPQIYHPNPLDEYLISNWLIQKWDSVDWENYFYYEYYYNSANQLIQIDSKEWDDLNSIWNNNKRDFLYYDSSGRLQEYYTEVWINNLYKNHSNQTYAYTSFDSLLVFQTYLWNDTTNSWNNNNKTEYIYDLNNYLIECVHYEGDMTNWNIDTRDTLTYDSAYNLISKVHQFWQSQWENVNQTLYYYDDNKLSQFVWQQWINNNWESDHRESFTYDSNNNLIERLNEIDSVGGWIYFFRVINYYNQFNQLDSSLTQYWSDNSWVMDRSIDYNYDSFGNLREYIIKIWFENNNWENQWRVSYNYLPVYISDYYSENRDFSLLNAYPNPFNPTTTIIYSIPKVELVKLKVYNAIGEMVTILVDEVKQAGTYIVKFEGKGWASGVYFYRLQAGVFVETKKMVLMK